MDTSEKREPRVAAVREIIADVIRYQRMPFSKLKTKSKEDWAPSLPHPSGRGYLLCGRRANSKIWTLARNALAVSEWKDRMEVSEVQRRLRDGLVRRFLKEHFPIHLKNVETLLSEAVSSAATECKTLTHFIPCHISSDNEPTAFEIGPVSFRLTAAFISEREHEFEKFVEDGARQLLELRTTRGKQQQTEAAAEEATDHCKALATGAKDWFSQFNWVATVTVHGCDAATSRTRAERAVETALNILRLMLGGSHGDLIRMDNHPMRPRKSASMTRNELGLLDLTLHLASASARLGSNWWTIINSGDNGTRMATAGRLINTITLLEPHRPLCERLIDALEWFGRGVSGNIPGARVVDYVTAIERVTLCPDEPPTKTVSERACILSSEDGRTLDEAKLRRIKRLYGLRSNVVHGSSSPFEASMEEAVYETEKLAATTIMRAIDLYEVIGAFGEKTNLHTLKAAFKHIEDLAAAQE